MYEYTTRYFYKHEKEGVIPQINEMAQQGWKLVHACDTFCKGDSHDYKTGEHIEFPPTIVQGLFTFERLIK